MFGDKFVGFGITRHKKSRVVTQMQWANYCARMHNIWLTHIYREIL